MLSHCALMGDPVAHSLSPQIHHAFAQQFALPLQYSKIRVGKGELASTLRSLTDAKAWGLNITAPLKKEAYQWADTLSSAAQQAASVNTLSYDSVRGWFGDNTDGVGLIRDLARLGFDLPGAHILILGSGAVVPGLIASLKSSAVAGIHLWHRGVALRGGVQGIWQANSVSFYDESQSGIPFDLVINATSAGVLNQALRLPTLSFKEDALFYDLNYGHAAQEFIAQATRLGAWRITDGFGMLVEQAAASFTLWHHHCPQTDILLEQLRGLPA